MYTSISCSDSDDSMMNHIQKYHPRAHANLKGRAYLLKARNNNPIINFNLIVSKMDAQKIDRTIKSLGSKLVNFIQTCPEINQEEDVAMRGALVVSVLLSLLGSYCRRMDYDENVFKDILQEAVNVYREG